MRNIFRAISIGMTVLGAVAEALDPDSEEGEDISQKEYIRISLRSGLAAVKAFGKEITHDEDTDILKMVEDELRMLRIIS